ncbi:putative uroporphyrinogen decarboxylase, chloroplastic-like [Capsicum annuum]|nr:putative uroporphyrinogen decarboxylase, chloroplastic-like [Capsicum annuum]
MKGVMRFGKRGKWSPCYVGPYQILRKIGTIAYELELPASLGSVHPLFHVSILKKCIGDHSMVLPVEGIKVTDSLSYEEEPVEILDRQVRKLRSKEIASIKKGGCPKKAFESKGSSLENVFADTEFWYQVHDYQTDRGVSDLHGLKCSSRPGPGSGRDTVIVAFCGVTYFEIVGSRTYQIPTKADFLGSLLPLICIPAVLSLGAGLFKWKDDNWKLSRGAYMFIIIGLLLLLGAISDIIVTIKPRAIGAAFLLVLLLLVLAIGVIHYWAAAFLVLYGIALAIEGWGVVASLQIYQPFAGAAVSAITLVVAFGFTVSRPCLTLKVCLDILE